MEEGGKAQLCLTVFSIWKESPHPVLGLEFRPKAWCSGKSGSFEELNEIAAWCLLWKRCSFNSAVFFLTDPLIQSKAPMKLCGISSYLFPCRKAGLHPCISKGTALLKSWLSCDLPSKTSFSSIKHPEQMTTMPNKFDPFWLKIMPVSWLLCTVPLACARAYASLRIH